MAQLSVHEMFVFPKGVDHTKSTWCTGVKLRGKEFPSAGSTSVQRCVAKAVMTPLETVQSLGDITKGDFPILDQVPALAWLCIRFALVFFNYFALTWVRCLF